MPNGVVEIGVEIFDPADRGTGIGTEAGRLLLRHLLANGVTRVQATTPVDNAAARAVLDKLGFSYEGTLRSYLPRPEGREDAAMYAFVQRHDG